MPLVDFKGTGARGERKEKIELHKGISLLPLPKSYPTRLLTFHGPTSVTWPQWSASASETGNKGTFILLGT